MQKYAAVFRDGPGLKEGVTKLESLYKDMDNIKVRVQGNRKHEAVFWVIPMWRTSLIIHGVPMAQIYMQYM